MIERYFSVLVSHGMDQTFQSLPMCDPTEKALNSDLCITVHRTSLDFGPETDVGTVVRAVWRTQWIDGEPTWVRVK